MGIVDLTEAFDDTLDEHITVNLERGPSKESVSALQLSSASPQPYTSQQSTSSVFYITTSLHVTTVVLYIAAVFHITAITTVHCIIPAILCITTISSSYQPELTFLTSRMVIGGGGGPH